MNLHRLEATEPPDTSPGKSKMPNIDVLGLMKDFPARDKQERLPQELVFAANNKTASDAPAIRGHQVSPFVSQYTNEQFHAALGNGSIADFPLRDGKTLRDLSKGSMLPSGGTDAQVGATQLKKEIEKVAAVVGTLPDASNELSALGYKLSSIMVENQPFKRESTINNSRVEITQSADGRPQVDIRLFKDYSPAQSEPANKSENDRLTDLAKDNFAKNVYPLALGSMQRYLPNNQTEMKQLGFEFLQGDLKGVSQSLLDLSDHNVDLKKDAMSLLSRSFRIKNAPILATEFQFGENPAYGFRMDKEALAFDRSGKALIAKYSDGLVETPKEIKGATPAELADLQERILTVARDSMLR
jgi:hypothetical protein